MLFADFEGDCAAKSLFLVCFGDTTGNLKPSYEILADCVPNISKVASLFNKVYFPTFCSKAGFLNSKADSSFGFTVS